MINHFHLHSGEKMPSEKELLEKIRVLEHRIAELESQCQINDRYHYLLDILHAGVVVHGPDTAILMVNQAAERILGLSRDQLQFFRVLPQAIIYFRHSQFRNNIH